MVFADSQKEDDTVSHYKHFSIAERESLYLGSKSGKKYPDDSPGTETFGIKSQPGIETK